MIARARLRGFLKGFPTMVTRSWIFWRAAPINDSQSEKMLSDIVRASPEDVRHMFDALETVAALPLRETRDYGFLIGSYSANEGLPAKYVVFLQEVQSSNPKSYPSKCSALVPRVSKRIV
jgi:hypothetical protein